MDDLYKEIILEHYRNPENRGEIEGGIEADEANMLCGDKLRIMVKLDGKKIVEAKFTGGGCAISMAAADMVLTKVVGMTLKEVKEIKGEEVEEMLGVKLTPARKKCAYLGLEVLKKL
jgi:nitrogen fixation NifU-like protein